MEAKKMFKYESVVDRAGFVIDCKHSLCVVLPLECFSGGSYQPVSRRAHGLVVQYLCREFYRMTSYLGD